MEIVDLYSRDGQLVDCGHVRWEPVPAGQYYKIINCLVQHQDGDFLLTERTATKKIYPGYYEATAGGAVDSGESEQTAARRELYEETGIQAQRLDLIHREIDEHYQMFYYVFYLETSLEKDQVRIQPEEVQAYRWLDLAAFRRLVHSGRVMHYDDQTLRLYLEAIQALQSD